MHPAGAAGLPASSDPEHAEALLRVAGGRVCEWLGHQYHQPRALWPSASVRLVLRLNLRELVGVPTWCAFNIANPLVTHEARPPITGRYQPHLARDDRGVSAVMLPPPALPAKPPGPRPQTTVARRGRVVAG